MVMVVPAPTPWQASGNNDFITLLHQLAESNQTGAIVAKRGEEAAIIYLRGGKIVGTSAPWLATPVPFTLAELATRTVAQVVAWNECEVRFHPCVQPRHQLVSDTVEVWHILRQQADDRSSDREARPASRPDLALETRLTGLVDRMPALILWATVKHPNQTPIALIEAVEIALQRILEEHRAFHAGDQVDHHQAEAGGKWCDLERVLTTAHYHQQRSFPALEAIQIVGGRLDLTDLLATYDLLTGPSRAAFYTEIVEGLIAIVGEVLDQMVTCMLHGRRPSDQALAGWHTFVAEAKRRLEAARP